MIETETIWNDSGFDCDHCGGEILERIDRETGQPDFTCYQCRECGCQWSKDGEVLRVGNGPYCKAAQRGRSTEGGLASLPLELEQWTGMISRSVWILLALVAGAILLLFGGAVVLRFLLPAAVIGVTAFILIRYGRQHL